MFLQYSCGCSVVMANSLEEEHPNSIIGIRQQTLSQSRLTLEEIVCHIPLQKINKNRSLHMLHK